jgi:hypothetical protein
MCSKKWHCSSWDVGNKQLQRKMKEKNIAHSGAMADITHQIALDNK